MAEGGYKIRDKEGIHFVTFAVVAETSVSATVSPIPTSETWVPTGETWIPTSVLCVPTGEMIYLKGRK